MPQLSNFLRNIAPGVALCFAVTLVAVVGDRLEARFFGRAWLEALVLAIIIGTAIRTVRAPAWYFEPGIDFAAKTLLEVAVVLLGLSVSTAAVVAAGPALIGGIVAIVALAIGISYGIGRSFGLSHKLAVLIACGNSICGNSAIAATAPVIHADSDDVAASIAFTAVFGVIVVLLLPLSVGLIGLTKLQYGIFAGLTVYAVPQVIAATAPIGQISVQVGTLVKLVRVLMLGPVVLALSMTNRSDVPRRRGGFGVFRFVPWFIIGFVALIGLRASGVVPTGALATAAAFANVLTTVAMAGLGLGVDVRAVTRAGGKVTAVVILSLLALCMISLILIFLLSLR